MQSLFQEKIPDLFAFISVQKLKKKQEMLRQPFPKHNFSEVIFTHFIAHDYFSIPGCFTRCKES